ncbi:sulfite exporter TauE/SafE family protein [Aquiflexum gelatinilyticum]|uniref:Probable membrane transporter protein n=1 Tax=Aquiflexum gelatinilyticum TaxID=2961943 RepID=A0A9X2P594_9BACT|nr:sulfite exporter TauE/SafE family protein [Aquiflexum gelatinilyticum]MCR9016614.1 sulfite exporter TauE/SafE family protein [Aquiflexum gelatinilyticum]MCS4432756.1 sulfite exporter TauE/SafE family protein [Aquiflexum gelatinilyticum]
MVAFIWISLAILTVWFTLVLTRDFLRHKKRLEPSSWRKTSVIGFVVNFFDVLGIGAFAPQTALLKFTKQTEDKLIPGTMNVANTLPVLLQALIFITIIEVEPKTLILMLVSAAIGAIVGAGVISKLSERKIRLTMGFALLITAGFMLARNLDWIQGGGEAIGLEGGKLLIAIVANFFLGALMTAGIGLYAPCMALVFALGMSPQVAFPIMMGSCAFLMPPASIRFIREGAYNRKAAVAMAIPGVVAVLIAAFIVKSLPLDILRWLVIVVILYTSTVMLRAGLVQKELSMDLEKK